MRDGNRTALIVAAAWLLALTGCQKRSETVTIHEPPIDVPLKVAWVNQHPDLSDIFMLNEKRGWAVGGSTLLETDDGGSTWRARALEARRMLRIRFVDEKTGWITANSTKTGLVLATVDGGQTWMRFPTPGIGPFYDIQFLNRLIGWAGDNKTVYRTSDGGRTWSAPQPGVNPSRPFHFVDESRGWATAPNGGIVVSVDGGKTWSAQVTNQRLPILAIFFLDRDRGWAARWNGVLWTTDGGRIWNPPRSNLEAYFRGLKFVDANRGWAHGRKARLLRTIDGGTTWESWQWREPPADWIDFESLHFASSNRGWAAGEAGAIFATSDGGIRWERQNPVPAFEPDGAIRARNYSEVSAKVRIAQVELNRAYRIAKVLFASASTGWAFGSFHSDAESDPVGVLLSTQNGGATWKSEFLQDSPQDMYFSPSGTGALFTVGFFENIRRVYRPVVKGRAPWIERFEFTDGPARMTLRWQVRANQAGAVKVNQVEFSQGTDTNFGPVKFDAAPQEMPGLFSLSFSPEEHGIASESEVHFRISLEDPEGFAYRQQLPRSFIHVPWWDRQTPLVKSGAIALTIGAAHLLSLTLLLFLFPLALVWLREHAPVEKLADLVPFPGTKLFTEALMAAFGLQFFVTRERVRKAWLRRFEADYSAFTNLSEPLREAFLAHADCRSAWLRHYGALRCRFAGLPSDARRHYVTEPDCLDAWVAVWAERASEAYGRLEAARQRPVWIKLPVRVGDSRDGTAITTPGPADLRTIFERECVIVEIAGEGGAGKSTFAIELGRWALASDAGERLFAHRPIPVFLAEETDDLISSIRGYLREAVGPEELDDDILMGLLASKRLLIIVDSLSERTAQTVSHVSSIHRHASVNALVLTTRRSLDYGTREAVRLRPEHVTVETLFYFLTEYLRRTGAAELFPGREVVQLGDRLLQAIERGTRSVAITPLLLTLFTSQAVAMRQKGRSLDELPASIPEIVLEHLRRTNPKGADVPNAISDDRLVRGAKRLARCSLGDEFIPREFFRDDAEKALQDAGRGEVVQRIIDNGVVQERDRAGTKILRFALDPVAEYLAALYWLDQFKGDPAGWSRWRSELSAREGYPEMLAGFLAALDNCLAAYAEELRLGREAE